MEVGDKAEIIGTATEDVLDLIIRLTGDINKIHLDEEYAKSRTGHGRIVHGIFCLGLISKLVGTSLPGHGSIIMSESVHFIEPVYLGETISCVGVIKKIKKDNAIIDVECKNQIGEYVLRGEVLVKIKGDDI